MRRILALMTAAALAGCGGGGEAADADGGYREQAQRACRAAGEAFAEVGPRSGAQAVERARAALGKALGDLEAAGPPDTEREGHERLLETGRELDGQLQRVARRLGGRGKAKQLHAAALRARSSADTLRTTAEPMGLKGCGEPAVAAADRILTGPYAVMAASHVAEYRRVIDRYAHDFSPAPGRATDQALDAVTEAPIRLDVGLGVLEPPARVEREHRRVMDEIRRLRDVTFPFYDGSISPARARRLLRDYRRREAHMRRAQNELLAATRHALR